MDKLLFGIKLYSEKLANRGYQLDNFSYIDLKIIFRATGVGLVFNKFLTFTVCAKHLHLEEVASQTSFLHIRELIEIEKEVLNELYKGQ